MMSRVARKFVRVTKFLLAGVTVFCVSWIACVNEWHTGVRWKNNIARNPSTMQTIVGYSEAKLAELDRPSPVPCDRLPAFPRIPYINRTWSPGDEKSTWQKVEGTSVSLYAAYYDERTSQPFVRFLASFQGRSISSEKQLYCQTRLINPNDNSVEVVAAKPLEIWWHEWDKLSSYVETPVLLSCPLTEPINGPSVVSVVTEPCDDPSNGFLLKKSSHKIQKTFTICVKDLSFQKDISQYLIEWIEINKLLGVDAIDMYIDDLSKESENILLRYRSEGYVRLFKVPIKSASDRGLWQRRRDHIISYNDCLYRNIIESKYVVPLDIDEILLPKIAYTWPSLIKRLEFQGWNPKQYSAILVRNVFFFDFMQNYKPSENIDEGKTYTKRDDVRIKSEDIFINETDLVNVSYKNNTNKSYKDDRTKSRCEDDLPSPKLASHIISSAVISPSGHYSKSFMLTKRVLTAFNHYPLASLGAAGIAGWSAPFNEVQLNHYKESCNETVVTECELYARNVRVDRSALRLRKPLRKAMALAICGKLNTA